jgi:phage protein D
LNVPAYKLQIGSRTVDTTDEPRASTLVDLTVSLDLDTPVDSATLVLGRVDGLHPAREDDLAIDLGYADDDAGLTRVLTGAIVTAEPGLVTSRAVGHGAGHPLLRTFADRTFEDSTAGAIVRELADAAGVNVARVEDGISFPAYVVDGRRSISEHLRDLADLCGFDAYVDADGDLVFERFATGRTVHVLEHAVDLLALDALEAPARAGVVEAWGEGPGGSRGGEAWAWLTKDFAASRGSGGTGSPTLLLERPALRTAVAAASAARAFVTAIGRRSLRGRLVTLGCPEIQLGDAIRIRSAPEEDLNASFQVRSVTHRLSKAGGFLSVVGFRSVV